MSDEAKQPAQPGVEEARAGFEHARKVETADQRRARLMAIADDIMDRYTPDFEEMAR